MVRRVCFSALLSLVLVYPIPHGGPLTSGGPPFWVIRRGESRVYLMGFGEARDTSWLTPAIRRAFDESLEVWLENAGPAAADNRDEAAKKAAAERMERLGHETGRTMFDVLAPSVRERTVAYLDELKIDRKSVETLRPWRAYYSIVSAFWANRKVPYQQVFVDDVLETKARSAGKSLGYEFPSRESFVDFMAAMPDTAQSQYLEWLLDFLDDYKQGHNDENETFGWIAGRNPPNRSLERMRTKMPNLYQLMQPQRNLWWAKKIEELLGRKGTYFVAVGQLHVMGPDGIPRQLGRMGIQVEPPL